MVSKAVFLSAWTEFCLTNGSQEYWHRFGDYLFTDPKRGIPQELLSLPPSALPQDLSAANAPCARLMGCSRHPRQRQSCAARSKPSTVTLTAGDLKYVIIGHGTKRPRKMFTDADLDAIHCRPNPKGFAVSLYRHPRSPSLALRLLASKVIAFTASTETTTRREAEKVEARRAREGEGDCRSTREVRQTSLRLDDVAGRYWSDGAASRQPAAISWKRLSLLIEFFGKDKLITDITDDDVRALIAWRRGHRDVHKAARSAGLPVDRAGHRQSHDHATEDAVRDPAPARE